MKRHKTVDDYIKGTDQWRDELKELRQVLNACGLTEEVKWGAPCYTRAGKNVVGMAGFKSYFGLWFHQGALLKEDKKVLINAQEGKTRALRQWRMASARDIKPALIRRYVKESIKLIEEGRSVAPARKKKLVLPTELEIALGKSKATQKKFETLTPGRQRDYAEHIASAKREATRESRLRKILPMIRAGIGLNDKYRC